MIVKGTEKASHYSASVLAEKIGITVEQARQLKQGKPVNLDNRTGDILLNHRIAVIVDDVEPVGEPKPDTDEENNDG
jgi:hypothetical protein